MRKYPEGDEAVGVCSPFSARRAEGGPIRLLYQAIFLQRVSVNISVPVCIAYGSENAVWCLRERSTVGPPPACQLEEPSILRPQPTTPSLRAFDVHITDMSPSRELASTLPCSLVAKSGQKELTRLEQPSRVPSRRLCPLSPSSTRDRTAAVISKRTSSALSARTSPLSCPAMRARCASPSSTSMKRGTRPRLRSE